MTSTRIKCLIKCQCGDKKGDQTRCSRNLDQFRWLSVVKILAIMSLVIGAHRLSDISKSRKEFRALTKNSSLHLKTNSLESRNEQDASDDIWKITHYKIINGTDDNVNKNVNKNEKKNVNNNVNNNEKKTNGLEEKKNKTDEIEMKNNGLEEKKNETDEEKKKLNNNDTVVSIDKDGNNKIEQNVIGTIKNIENNNKSTDTVSYLRGKQKDEDKNEDTSTNSNNNK